MNGLNESDVLYEDNHLLVVNKPAGILSMGDDTGDSTIAEMAARYLKVKYNKPGNVFVGVVHRLDRPVSGVLVLARTSKAASRLSDQFRKSVVKKTYTAIVEGTPQRAEATLTDYLLKDHRTNKVSVVSENQPGSKKSILRYAVQHHGSDQAVLGVYPETGRSHQIRVQLANCGHPIVGDTRYGSQAKTGGRIYLHASSIQVEHPTQKTQLQFDAKLPIEMQRCLGL
ncbi:MAG: RluA family pseudouridine synthase [Fuerstiella sp.]